MALSSQKTRKNLLKKGFSVDNNHHKFLKFFHEGEMILHTKISHGSDHDLDNYLIKQMSNQCKLSKDEFCELALCPMSQEEFIKILREKNFL